MSLLPPRRRRYWINIVPLVDVLTILIFFFLITMHFKPASALKITPPKIESAAPDKADSATILLGVDQKGVYFLDRQAVELDNLKIALKNRAQKNPDAKVIIKSDEEAPLKYLTALMDACHQAKLEAIELESR